VWSLSEFKILERSLVVRSDPVEQPLGSEAEQRSASESPQNEDDEEVHGDDVKRGIW
jgi:hypothetical protein